MSRRKVTKNKNENVAKISCTSSAIDMSCGILIVDTVLKEYALSGDVVKDVVEDTEVAVISSEDVVAGIVEDVVEDVVEDFTLPEDVVEDVEEDVVEDVEEDAGEENATERIDDCILDNLEIFRLHTYIKVCLFIIFVTVAYFADVKF